MKILFVASEINSRIRTMLKLKFNATVEHAKSGIDAKNILNSDEDISLIIGDSNADSMGELIKFLIETNSINPYLDISEGEISSSEVLKFIEDQEDIIRAPTPIDVKVFEGIVSSAIDVFQRKLNDKYREIRIENLKHIDSAICEIYIKLSSTKYIKYIEKGSEFTGEIIEDLAQRKVKRLFVEKEYVEEFSNLATANLISKFDDENLSSEDRHVLSIISNETIKQNLKNIGVSPLTLELGQKTLVNTAKTFCADKKLESMLTSLCNSDNYEAEHCVMISYIGMGVINNSDWNSPENHLKMCAASLLHDASLIGTGLSIIGENQGKLFDKLNHKQQKLYLANPEESAKIVDSCKIFPSDTQMIVLEQGERPGGQGFPKGLDSTQIKPLSAVFVVAHDFVHKIYHLGMNGENKGIVMAELEAKYNEGNFLKAYKLLEKTLS